jgi:hypothetical protein
VSLALILLLLHHLVVGTTGGSYSNTTFVDLDKEAVKVETGKVKQQLPEFKVIKVAFTLEKITRERHSALD